MCVCNMKDNLKFGDCLRRAQSWNSMNMGLSCLGGVFSAEEGLQPPTLSGHIPCSHILIISTAEEVLYMLGKGDHILPVPW